MSDADVNHLTVRVNGQTVEFFGASPREILEAKTRFIEWGGCPISGWLWQKRKGVVYLVGTCADPDASPFLLRSTEADAEREKEDDS